jgi:hypothetical protein
MAKLMANLKKLRDNRAGKPLIELVPGPLASTSRSLAAATPASPGMTRAPADS